jgi:hypothetical protein
MSETRSLEQIEADNPGFWITRRYDKDGVEYSVLTRDQNGILRHLHGRALEQLQPLIERLRALQCR